MSRVFPRDHAGMRHCGLLCVAVAVMLLLMGCPLSAAPEPLSETLTVVEGYVHFALNHPSSYAASVKVDKADGHVEVDLSNASERVIVSIMTFRSGARNPESRIDREISFYCSLPECQLLARQSVTVAGQPGYLMAVSCSPFILADEAGRLVQLAIARTVVVFARGDVVFDVSVTSPKEWGDATHANLLRMLDTFRFLD